MTLNFQPRRTVQKYQVTGQQKKIDESLEELLHLTQSFEETRARFEAQNQSNSHGVMHFLEQQKQILIVILYNVGQ